MNQFTITPETCSRKANGVNFDFTFTLMHVPVVIVNDSFVHIKKSNKLLVLSPSPVIFKPPPLISQSSHIPIDPISFFLSLTEYLVSLGNTSHYGSDLTLMLTGAGVCCL